MAIIITDEDVKKNLSMRECIEAMRVAFRDYALGKAKTLPRARYRSETPDPSREYFANVHIGAVPSYGMACVRAGSQLLLKTEDTPGRKILSNFDPVNWTVIILYDLATAEPLAFIHESYLSGFRVGATTGAAMDSIARDEVEVLGVFGTGRQARANCEAICCVRPSIKRVKVFSPNAEHRATFVNNVTLENVEVIPVETPKEVVKDSEIICCATNTTQPVFDGNLLEKGQIVISIANSDVTAKRHEVDETTFAQADAIIVNDWQSVETNQQTELLSPISKQLVDKNSVYELGNLFAGKVKLSQNDDRIIYYKNNTGLGMQFAAAGAIIYEKMKGNKTNREIPRDWLASEDYSQS